MATETETKTEGFEKGADAAKEGDSTDLSPLPDADADADADAPSKKKKKRKAATDALPELEVDLSLPEPPSKRARRALKKGKPLPAKPKSDDEDDEDDNDESGKKGKNDKDGKPAKEPRSQFGIWIGNLPFHVTRTQLFRWFVDSSGGAITADDITRVNLPTTKKDKRWGAAPRSSRHEAEQPETAEKSDSTTATATTTSQNKGFAYVDFATYAAQIAAVALSETELDGRRVLIKDSKSFAGRPAPTTASAAAAANGAASSEGAATAQQGPLAAPPGAASTKIFVGNLGFDTTEEDLRRHFAPCGPVAWAKVATFPDNTEKCRGFGWVQFGGGGATAAADEDDEDDDEGKSRKPAERQSPATASAIAGEAAAAAVRGFVRVQETVDTEEDFVAEAAAAEGEEEEAGDDENDEGAIAERGAAPPRTRTRKWWVNMLKGRPLKVQFAEDDRVRYKKRFGKDRPQDRPQQQKNDRPASTHTQHREPRQQPRDRGGDDADKPYKYQDLSIARRTGAITESLGKKTMLE